MQRTQTHTEESELDTKNSKIADDINVTDLTTLIFEIKFTLTLSQYQELGASLVVLIWKVKAAGTYPIIVFGISDLFQDTSTVDESYSFKNVTPPGPKSRFTLGVSVLGGEDGL